MQKKPIFYTASLAKLYEKQGYIDEAAEIYSYLLQKEPYRKDLIEGLRRIKEQGRAVEIPEFPQDKPNNIVALFSEWFELLIPENRLIRLKELKNQFR
ncbi:MAG: hypothetical protein HQK77_08655 [Desulfobacterales bacterium]|nr:hypothetical protein [Desulfobacterales bacterium]